MTTPKVLSDKKAAKFYEAAEYEKALPLLIKLSNSDDDLAKKVKPCIEFCENAIKVVPSLDDKIHKAGNEIKKQIRLLWLSVIYLLLPFIEVLVWIGDKDRRHDPFLFHFSPLLIIWLLIGGLLGIMIYFIIDGIYGSFCPLYDIKREEWLRCKYCGHYTPYCNPRSLTSECKVCGRHNPMPSVKFDLQE